MPLRRVHETTLSRSLPGRTGVSHTLTRMPSETAHDPGSAPRDRAAEPDLTDRLKAEARRLGFDQVGIAEAVAPPGYPRFLEWPEGGDGAGGGFLGPPRR